MKRTPDPDELVTGLIRMGADGRIAWLNRSAADLLKRSPGTLTGSRLADHSPLLARWMKRARDGGRSLHVPESRLEDGSPVVDLHFHASGDDILIELHPVAERLRQRELAERADRSQAMTLLTRRLAHELRNPLAGVRGAAQLIAAMPTGERTGDHARMIQREVDRITGLIERFAGDEQPQIGPVNLHRVLDDVAALVTAEGHDRMLIDKDFDPSIPTIEADEGQLHQVFLNLVRNAAQAGSTRVHLRTRIEHHCALLDQAGRHAVRIDVEDDGGGVDPSLRERLFLPLVSGRSDGSGFGLAIVQQIVRAHGGLVEYQPLEVGSRFRVRLPLIPAGEPVDG
jgi:two-component system, NtrC family, nitrogen regulation sensor histidine kinase GlnL